METLLFEDSIASHAPSVRECLPNTHLVLCTETFDNVTTPTIFSYLVGLARKHSLLTSWQTTVLSDREFFESLKVVCCRLNLASHGEFNVTDSHVITAQSAYFSGEEMNPSAVAYRDFLKECNAIDQFGLLQLLKRHRQKLETDLNQSFRIEGIVRSAWQSAAVSFLAENKPKRRVLVELPVDGDSTEIVTSQIRFESVDECHPKDVSCPKQSQSLVYTLTTLKSFLNLLVNSRDEVAIACALACPLVNLSHEAFTKVKRAASKQKSPIYQFVLSYIMKIRLRGPNCTVQKDCPIAKYVKELTYFVDVMDKLQTLIEDNPTTSAAVGKITACVLGKLSKAIAGKSMKMSMIDKARNIVKDILERIRIQNPATDPTINPGIIGKDTITVLRALADELATLGFHQKLSKILCSPFSAATPSKTPVGAHTLFRLFESPKETKDDDDEVIPLASRVPLKANAQPEPVVAFRVKYEPKPPKQNLYEEHHRLCSKADEDQQGQKACLTPLQPPKTLRLNKNNNETPVGKNPKKRKNADDREKGPKKRLILISANDQENRSDRELKAKQKQKSKVQNKARDNSKSNQRTIHSFFAKI